MSTVLLHFSRKRQNSNCTTALTFLLTFVLSRETHTCRLNKSPQKRIQRNEHLCLIIPMINRYRISKKLYAHSNSVGHTLTTVTTCQTILSENLLLSAAHVILHLQPVNALTGFMSTERVLRFLKVRARKQLFA